MLPGGKCYPAGTPWHQAHKWGVGHSVGTVLGEEWQCHQRATPAGVLPEPEPSVRPCRAPWELSSARAFPGISALRWGNFRAGPASPVPAPLEIFYGHLKGLGTTWAALRRIRKVLAHQLQEWPAQQGWQDVVIVKAHQSQPSQTFNLSIVFLLDKSFSFSVAPILLSAASVGAMCVILGEARLKISWLSP